jgi:hypothetical protein
VYKYIHIYHKKYFYISTRARRNIVSHMGKIFRRGFYKIVVNFNEA